MTTSVLVVVLIAIGLAYALGKRSTAKGSTPAKQDGHTPGAVSTARDLPTTPAKVEALLASWCPILASRRNLTSEELDKFVNFVIIARATRSAAEKGRTFMPADLNDAIAWRSATLAEADSAWHELQQVSAAWEQEINETGREDGPTAAKAREAAKRYERYLRDAGEVNALREWREGLNNTADRLRLSELLTGVVLDDPHGPLTPAERGYADALVRARLGDSSRLNFALRGIIEQNGSSELTVAQASRIAQTLERESDAATEAHISAAESEDTVVATRLMAEDASWGTRLQEVIATGTPNTPPVLLSDDDAAKFRLFTATKQAVRFAQAEGRPGSRYTSTDLLRATIVCQQKQAAAASLWPQLVQAHDEWVTDINRTGSIKCPAGDYVQSLSERIEDLAFDGGDFNLFVRALCWRKSKTDFAQELLQKKGQVVTDGGSGNGAPGT